MTGQKLCEAARDGDAAMVSTLLSTQGAQFFINYQDADGATPLHEAAGQGHAAVTKQLLEARCNVNLQDAHGNTPLHFTAECGNAAVTKQLVAARCNVDLQRHCNWHTPLHVAAFSSKKYKKGQHKNILCCVFVALVPGAASVAGVVLKVGKRLHPCNPSSVTGKA